MVFIQQQESEFSYEVGAVLSLPETYRHGLIGMDLMNKMVACIYGDPNNKHICLKPEYM